MDPKNNHSAAMPQTKKRKSIASSNGVQAEPVFNSHDAPAPYSDDEIALQRLRDTDYSIKMTLEQAKAGTAPRRVRVYADGVYDMFHSGHTRQLMQVKQLVPNAYLIVGDISEALLNKRLISKENVFAQITHVLKDVCSLRPVN